jgi:hypothetical protein
VLESFPVSSLEPMQEMTVFNMAHAKVKKQKFMNSTGVSNSQSHMGWEVLFTAIFAVDLEEVKL